MTFNPVIRVRYESHPSSNVGNLVARGAGRQATTHYPQHLTRDDAWFLAAHKLATKLGVQLTGSYTEESPTRRTYTTHTPQTSER